MYTCICIYIYIFVCTTGGDARSNKIVVNTIIACISYIYLYKQIYMLIHVYVYTYINMHIHQEVTRVATKSLLIESLPVFQIYIYTNKCVFIYVYVYMCIYVYVYTPGGDARSNKIVVNTIIACVSNIYLHK